MYIICAKVNGVTTDLVGRGFEDKEMLEKLIEIPLVTDYGTFRPNQMFIEEAGESYVKISGRRNCADHNC